MIDRVYVDAAALYLVPRPHTFDVLVTENMFGDILSDLAAGLVGGIRVPFVVSWPGRVKPGVFAQPVIFCEPISQFRRLTH